MKKVGEGYYYAVYELSPTRVVKKQTSSKSKLVKLIAWYGYNPLSLSRKILQLEQSALKSIELSRRLSGIPELKALLGNPIFMNDYDYEQDRATPLEIILNSKGEREFLTCVQEYIDAHILLWKFGYGDVVYNFTLNAGVSVVTEKVILLDFNELSQNKEKIVKDIETRKWVTQASMRSLKKSHPGLYAKVGGLLESAFSLDNLDTHWRSRC